MTTPLPVVFPKNASSKESKNPGFFKSFLKISLKFLKSFKTFSVNISYFQRFSSLVWIFWHFLATKKLMASSYKR